MNFFERPDEVDRLIQRYRHDTLEVEDEEEEEVVPKAKFVDAWWFNSLVTILIFANAVTIGLETNANRNTGSTGMWYIIEVSFVSCFTIELILRMQQHKLNFFLDHNERGWNIMDLAIIGVSVVDILILMPLGLGNTLRFVSMLRFVRLTRLVRLIRLLRFFRELWLVASGFLYAMRHLLWVVMMLFTLCYMGSTFLTIMVGRNNRDYNAYFKESGFWDHEVYFDTVWSSMFTFFQIVTLDGWAELLVRHVGKAQPGMFLFFVLFICAGVFGVLNLMIGVVVERAIRTAAKDSREEKLKYERSRQLVFKQLKEIFESADVDGSGSLSFQEVMDAINKPEIYSKLRMIDFPVDNPREVFVLLDFDNTGELTIEEFIKGCLRMKGPAMSKDLLVAQVAIDTLAKQYQLFENELRTFKKKLNRLDATARALTNQGEKIFLDAHQYRLRHPSKNTMRMSDASTWDAGGEQPWERWGSIPSKVSDKSPWRPTEPDIALRLSALGNDSAAWHSDLAQLEAPEAAELEQVALPPAPPPPALPDGYRKKQERPLSKSLEALEDAADRQLALPGAPHSRTS